MNCPRPKCGAKMRYIRKRVPRLTGGTTEAGYWACFRCWYKVGDTDASDGVLPATVKRRERRSWYDG